MLVFEPTAVVHLAYAMRASSDRNTAVGKGSR